MARTTAVIDGDKLRAARRAQVLSIVELAQRTNLSKSLVGAIERGESGASEATIRTLAGALNLRPSDLLSDTAPADGES